MNEPSKEALEAIPDNNREWAATDLGKAVYRLESALGVAWAPDQRESASRASLDRDWGRVERVREALKQELRLALDRSRAEERERCAPVIEWAREAVTAREARAGWSLANDQLRKALAVYDGEQP